MIEIIELIWKHGEAQPLEEGAMSEDGYSLPTMLDAGGAAFSLVKRITATPASIDTVTLVAAGKSYLSYFYVGVCSSVLYLDPSSIDNDAILFRGDAETPMALEIHYHKPARAVDLKWATSSFIEANLLPDEKISDLPASMQRRISQYNELYRNIRSGDRYSLTYLPGIGLRLSLNDEMLGTIGMEMPGAERRELAKLIYSVWFGQIAPFSLSMRDELLTPLSRPRHNAMVVDATFATSRHHRDNGLLRALLGAVDDVYHDTMLRGTVFALVIFIVMSSWMRIKRSRWMITKTFCWRKYLR